MWQETKLFSWSSYFFAKPSYHPGCQEAVEIWTLTALIIGGRTIDSALGFSPMETNCYVQTEPARMATMKYQYEDADVLFIDEISMVGSMKLTKINFRLQDLADGDNKLRFMGGRSLVASGNFYV